MESTINREGTDVRGFWNNNADKISDILEDNLSQMGAIKSSFLVDLTLEKGNKELDITLRADSGIILESTNIEDALQLIIEEEEKLANFTKEGSGWNVKSIDELSINSAQYVTAQAGSYVALPVWVERKKAIVNVKNKDNRCLHWAIRSFLFPPKSDPNRVTKYPTEDGLDWTGISFPSSSEDLDTFEKNNPYKINVYTCREEVIVPMRL